MPRRGLSRHEPTIGDSVKRNYLLILMFAAAASLGAAEDVLKWNKTPEAYFMTPAERTEWAKVTSPDDAQKFIDDYRRKRGEQFLKDVRTRIDVADKQFKFDKTSGALTPRGRVYILLGPPSRMTTNRDQEDSRVGEGFSRLPLEGRGFVQSTWTYDADRLPAELGMKQLIVKFQTDHARGGETIENPGFVEPYLTRAAEYISNKYMATTQAQMAQRGTSAPAAPVSQPTAADPLWNATANLNGALFTGETFVSPREEPFYAYSFFIPPTATAFNDWKSALVVSLVKDASGQQVLSDRHQLDISAYDESGSRFVDRSLALAPGKYEGLFALYTPDGGTLLSSHRTTFEIAPKDAPRASALMLTSKVDVLEAQDALDPFTFVATKYAVRGDRRFRPTDKLAFFTIIANPNGSPQPNLMQKMIFKRDGKEFARTPLEPAQVTQTGPNTFLVGTAFDPDTFQAGHYSLELQVRDMNAPEGSELKTKGYVLTSEFDIVK